MIDAAIPKSHGHRGGELVGTILQLAATAGESGGGAGGCFESGTLVLLCDGSQQPIETIRAHDTVRRLATTGDTQFRTQADALAEALERHGIDPSTVEVTPKYGKNQNLLGPKGQPWHEITGLNSDGKPIEFHQHSSGHFYGDTNEFELPHYHGPDGDHLTY